MEVDADHTVRARRRQHVRHQLGGDGLAAGRLAILAAVAVVGADGGDALGRRPLGRVDHDQLLHQRVVDRPAVGLEDEEVAAADRALVAAEHLAVGEFPQVDLGQLDAEVAGDGVGQCGMRPASGQGHAALGDQLALHARDVTAAVRGGRRVGSGLCLGPPAARSALQSVSPSRALRALNGSTTEASSTTAPGPSETNGPTRALGPTCVLTHTE